MIIDTHSHIYDKAFDQDIHKVIERSKNANVEYVLLPNIDAESIPRLEKLSKDYPDYCLPMMGLHPTSVNSSWQQQLADIRKHFELPNKYIAVGEIGIDLYWDKSLEVEQQAAFEEQLTWSIQYDLPVSIHCRNAVLEVIKGIRRVGADRLRGVFHSFGGNANELKEALTLQNFLIGVNGTVTYKNSTLPQVLTNTNLSRIIVETDAPYLPPVPYRGKRNEPVYTQLIIDKLSDIYATPAKEVENITTRNAKELYNIL